MNDLAFIKRIKNPEVTTSMLLAILSKYSDPRKKINNLVKKGILRSIKQGVFLVREEYSLRSYSKEILANLIYGPSYISLETALVNYGVIPERVNIMTSICLGRGKSFSTPVGEFEYYHIKESIYPHGVQLKEVFSESFCQHASLEKALLDTIYIRETKGEFKNQSDYFNYIIESYRFDLHTIEKNISLRKLQKLSELYTFQTVKWFTNELTRKLLK
jgi:predicted transcriptional regulator of viral defense system